MFSQFLTVAVSFWKSSGVRRCEFLRRYPLNTVKTVYLGFKYISKSLVEVSGKHKIWYDHGMEATFFQSGLGNYYLCD